MADIDVGLPRDSGSPLTDLDDERRRGALSHDAPYTPGGYDDAHDTSDPLLTPARRGGPASRARGSGRKRGTTTPSSEVSAARREANRLAAERSRVRQGERAKILEAMAKGLAEENMALKERVRKLVVMGVVPPEGLEALVRAIVAPPAIGGSGGAGGSAEGENGQRQGEEINDAEAQALLQHLSQGGRGGQPGQGPAQAGPSTGNALFPSESVDGLLNLGLGNVGSNALSDLAAAAEAATASAYGSGNAEQQEQAQDQQSKPVDPSALDPAFAQESAAGKSPAPGSTADAPPAPAPTLADPSILNASLNKEIEALLQQELEELQARVNLLAAAGSPAASTSPGAAAGAGAADERVPSEILILRDMERRMRAETELARDRRARLKREMLGEEEGEGEGRTGVLVEKALTDVKARVELLLNHYNPSYVFSPLSAEDAFTLPERFEPIPLPEPQRRGRPAKNPSADSSRNKRPRKSSDSSSAMGRYEGGDADIKRARTRLGRSEHEYHPARPSGLAHELRPDEMDLEHDQRLSLEGHHGAHGRSRSATGDADMSGEMGGDPSLAQAEADAYRREQMGGYPHEREDEVHQVVGGQLGQYLSDERGGGRQLTDLFGAGVN